MLKVFSDFHHASLLHSLILLFEDRLGGELYRPIGKEWFNQGYWAVYDHPATAEQFLGINGATPDGTEQVNDVKYENNGIYHCFDIDSRFTNKAITLEAFKRMDFDIVIASIPQHIEPFKRLIAQHKPNAKLIYQVGNNWDISHGSVKNALISADILVPDGVNYVKYHQEFDLGVFRYREPKPSNIITSLVNCFNTADLFKEDWELFQRVEKAMNYKFRVLGGGCRDGSANGSVEVANAIAESKFVWHTKRGGDGYGHIIHNVFAIGRPPIVKMNYYTGKLAGKLMTDGITCINIDGLEVEKIVEKIDYYTQGSRYENLCTFAHNRFNEVVDFNREEKEIRRFIAMLQ